MTFVYIIREHDEGAGFARATTDRARLQVFVRDLYKDARHGDIVDKALTSLGKLLEKTDEELAGDGYANDLLKGWGGPQLQVIKLE